ncbi:MAG: PIN domain-containing protein [Pseudomonadota bacterium]
MAHETVFLDACVLYPPLVRTLALKAANAGLYRPLWSARVLDEWRLALARKETPEAVLQAEAAIAGMGAAFPNALAPSDPGLEATLSLPDPADAHVLAAAAGGGATILLTFNLRDFPPRTAAAHGLGVRHPDGFFWELFSHHPETMDAVLASALPDEEADGRRRALKRAKLSRFAKAVMASQ